MDNLFSGEPLISEEELEDLLLWFRKYGIPYPWGDEPTAYRVWISEIMLQQTVVTAAVNHYKRWMRLFPDCETLAAAGEQDVLLAWEGLGYYSRAKNILKGARRIMTCRGGQLPAEYGELRDIPGIGDYTARAILSLAYGQPHPVLDANVRRIAQRLKAVKEWNSRKDKELLEALGRTIPPGAPGEFNCAFMQLGQQICRTKSPSCLFCPFRGSCQALRKGLQDEIPSLKKKHIKEKHSTLLLLQWENTFLLEQRSKGIGKDLWFIPACRIHELEKICLSLPLKKTVPLPPQTHFYTSWKERLNPHLYILSEKPDKIPPGLFSGEKQKWIPREELSLHPSPSVYRKILEALPL